MFDVAIVGAGPAGLAAAELLSAASLRVAVIDEQPRPGGQIFRQPPSSFTVKTWLADSAYTLGKALLRRVSEDPRIDWQLATSVVGIEARQNLGEDGDTYDLILNRGGSVTTLSARRVLIATGCYDLPIPMPGWTLPGVMAAGGIQAFVKSQQYIAGDRLVFAGTHPLQLVVADQIVRAGGRVDAVLFAQSFFEVLRAALCSPWVVMRSGQLGHFLQLLFRLQRAGTPIRFGECVIEARGADALEAVVVAPVGTDGAIDHGKSYEIACDRLGLCFGFLASSELTRQLSVEHFWSDSGGGWIARCDEWMRTNRPGISVAGEITGVAGATVSEDEGRIAAFGILMELGRYGVHHAQTVVRPVRRRLARRRAFARLLQAVTRPAARLLHELRRADVILCKCEEVSFAQLEQVVREHPTAMGANAVKLMSRIGMGLCQGRYCQSHLHRHMQALRPANSWPPTPFSVQLPIKPVRIGDIAAAFDEAASS